MIKKILALCAFVAAPLAAVGCGSADDQTAEGTASAVIAITTVPSGVQCLSITATGSRAVTSTFNVMTGAAATLSMQSLPTGSVTFSGNAFAAACSAVTASDVPTFVGVPTVAQLTVGTVAQVTLPMARNGRASVTVDFEGDLTMCAASGQTCTAANPCCSGLTCTTGANGTQTCSSTTMCGGAGAMCTAAIGCCTGFTCSGGICN